MSDTLPADEIQRMTGYKRPYAPLWSYLTAWRDACPMFWGGFLLRPGGRTWAMNELSEVPMCSGLYYLSMDDGGVVYIGRSGSLNDRLKTHYYNARAGRSAWYDRFAFVPVPEYAVGAMEIAHIHALEPERNGLYEPPTWHGHDAVVAALRAVWGIE